MAELVPTLADVARHAGVSLATVDRVINRRPNVKAPMIERVRQAMAELDYRPDQLAAALARRHRHRFIFLLPSGTNAFIRDLASQVTSMDDWLASRRASIKMLFADIFDPTALAAAIGSIDRDCDGAAIVALDHPEISAAIDRLVAEGVPVVTLVSDAPASRRKRFVGVDNAAAGRTAGALIGRFSVGRAGNVALLVGSLSLRDHAERCFGFSQIIRRDHDNLSILPAIETRDDRDQAEAIVGRLLVQEPNLVAIYNAGAGNRGIAGALLALPTAAHSPIFVGHELTASSIDALRSGLFTALLVQNAGHEARSAARILLAEATGGDVIKAQERIRIDIVIRENFSQADASDRRKGLS